MPHDERALTQDFLRELMREQYRESLKEEVDKEKWPNTADRQAAVNKVVDVIASTGLNVRGISMEIIRNKLENETDTILTSLVDIADGEVPAQLKKWYKDNVGDLEKRTVDVFGHKADMMQESNERICERDLTKDFLKQILSE